MPPKFRGCFTATLTPFSESGVNLQQIKAHTNWLIENGAEGLCPAGTTGEFLYLSETEKAACNRAVIAAADKRVPIIAGVWALNQNEVLGLVKSSEQDGADGLFLPPPIYYPASDDAIYAWYAAIREITNLPLFAYNIPQYAANAISFECIERLISENVISGIKDSTGNAERIGEMIKRFGERTTIFAASDSFVTTGRKLGADGFISAISNVFPALVAAVWNGEDSKQAALDSVRGLLKQVGAISGMKYLLSKQGFDFGPSRIPCSALTQDQISLLDQFDAQPLQGAQAIRI